MKNFIFALCGFLMMSLVSLSVQASSVESSKCEYVTPSVDASLPDIQFVAFETVPADCIVQATPQTLFLLANAPAMVCMMKKEAAVRWKRIDVPKCSLRYIYKSKYCTHYSYTAYSKLITPC